MAPAKRQSRDGDTILKMFTEKMSVGFEKGMTNDNKTETHNAVETD
jgi:hypothetical protein